MIYAGRIKYEITIEITIYTTVLHDFWNFLSAETRTHNNENLKRGYCMLKLTDWSVSLKALNSGRYTVAV